MKNNLVEAIVNVEASSNLESTKEVLNEMQATKNMF